MAYTADQLLRARAMYLGQNPDEIAAQQQPLATPYVPQPVVEAPVADEPVMLDPEVGDVSQQPAMQMAAQPEEALAPPEAMVVPAAPAQPAASFIPTDTSGLSAEQAVQASMSDYEAANMAAQQAANLDPVGLAQISEEKQAAAAQYQEQVARDISSNDELTGKFGETYDKLVGEFRDLNKQIASTQIRDRSTTGQVVVRAIAQAFAGLGDAMNARAGRSTNFLGAVTKQIDSQVDRDIALQRMALDEKRTAAAAKLTELGVARSRFKDESTALSYARAARKEQYAARMGELAARTQNVALQSQIRQAQASLAADAAKWKTEVFMKKYQEEERAKRPDFASQLALANFEISRARFEMEREREGRKREARQYDPEIRARDSGARLSSDLVVADPNIAPLHARKAGEMQEGVDTVDAALEQIDRILEARSAASWGEQAIPGTAAYSTLQAEGTGLNLKLKDAENLGVLAGPDLDLLISQTGDPNALFFNKPEAKLKVLKYDLQRAVNRQMKKRGFAPVYDVPEPARSTVAHRSPKERIERSISGSMPSNSGTKPVPGKYSKYKVSE